MDRRHAAYAVMGLLGVVCLAMLASVVFPLSTADPTPAADSFQVGDADGYRLVSNLSADGTTALGVEAAIGTSGARYANQTQVGVYTESYQNTSRGGPVYRRTVADGAHAERLLQERQDDAEMEVVDHTWDGETLTMFVVDRSGRDVDPSGTASVVAQSLRLARWEPADAGTAADRGPPGTETTTLHPRPGWYEGSDHYRVTDVHGAVTVGSETNVLYDADVRWTITEPADSYLHYLLASGSATDHRYRYTYEPGDVDVERPAWVDEIAAETE